MYITRVNGHMDWPGTSSNGILSPKLTILMMQQEHLKLGDELQLNPDPSVKSYKYNEQTDAEARSYQTRYD